MRPRSCSKGRGRACSKAARPGSTYDVHQPGGGALSTRPSPGIENADAILLVGTNPRWEAPLVNTRLRKAAAQGREGLRHRPGGRPRHARSNGSATISSCSASCPRQCRDAFAKAERPAVIVGAGRAGRRRAGRGARRWSSAQARHVTAGTASTSSTLPASRMAGLMLGYAQPGGIADIEAAKPEARAAARRRRGRGRPLRRTLQGLYRPPWRQGRAAGRPRPAGRRLYRKARHLRQSSKAACSAASGRSFPPGDAREDWTIFRALSRAARQAAAVRQLRPAARARWSPSIPSSAATGSIDLPWAPPKLDAKAEGPVALSDRGLLPDQRHLPRQPDHAALLGGDGPRRPVSRRRRNDRLASSPGA